jgi:anti-sigma B factor antagonist
VKLADVQFTHHDQIVVAGVTGEIDLSNTAGIERVIAEAMTNEELALILDLSQVDYLDSAGIQLLYQLRERLRVRSQVLRLVIPASSPANHALKLAGISRYIDMSETVEDATHEAQNDLDSTSEASEFHDRSAD